MNVTCFICSLSSGGAEHQMIELTHLLQEKGYKITLATFADIDDHYQMPDKVKRIRIGQGKSGLLKILDIFLFFISVKTDCIISFGQRENLLILVPLLLRPKIKVIAGERNLTYGKPTFIEWLLMKILYRRANFIVSNSYAQANYIKNTVPHYADKVVTITNYTDLSLYKCNAYTLHDILRIGIFSRYNSQKNCKRFVEAVRLIKEKDKRPFLIEWYGNQYLKDKTSNRDFLSMQELVYHYGLEDVLLLKDHIKDVCSVMEGLDAVCLPSLFEGFSNAISEAICCARPMLVSDVSDNGLMVKDGINGYLFNPLDIDNIASAFIKFFALKEKDCRQMSINSRKIAEELFDAETFVNKYVDLLDR